MYFNLIQDGWAKKPPTSFLAVTFTDVGISPQNILISVPTFLPHLCKI